MKKIILVLILQLTVLMAVDFTMSKSGTLTKEPTVPATTEPVTTTEPVVTEPITEPVVITPSTTEPVTAVEGTTSTIEKWHDLVNRAKSGELKDITYIMVGDSHRANPPLYTDMIQPAFTALNVKSVLNASGGQTAYDWARNIDQNKVTQVIASIPGTGEHTLVDISFGGNDYGAGYSLETTRDSLFLGAQKIKDAKPDTLIIWTSYPPANNDNKNVWEDDLFKLIETTSNYPVIHEKKDLFPLSWAYYDNDGQYQDQTHLSTKGQERVANYLLDILIPKN